MTVFSEIFRFTLTRSSSNLTNFRNLRVQVRERGMVNTQYFGYILSNSMPKGDDICWYIEWPEASTYRNSKSFITAFLELANDHPRSLLFKFWQKRDTEIIKALESPVCEIAFICLPQSAPRFTHDFEHSMHKTFTDCYLAPGGNINGGGWAYALNSNDSAGEEVQAMALSGSILNERERMLAYYGLGWNSREDHEAFMQTELFHEEIDKLTSYYGPGTGNYWVEFQKHE